MSVGNRAGGGSQIPLPLTLGDQANFENFWIGHNHELVTAIKSRVLTGEPGVLYFYGPHSSGKSHLLFAAMRLARHEVVNTSYLALDNPRVTTAMLSVVDVKHLVCVDNLEQWAGDEQQERALFTLLEQVRHHRGQLLISATHPPDKCGIQLLDLVSRLSSGLVYPLRALSEEQQFEAIRMRAQLRGLRIADDAIKYLLSRSSRDTGELFSMLDRIDRASLIEKRRITIPFLQTLITR